MKMDLSFLLQGEWKAAVADIDKGGVSIMVASPHGESWSTSLADADPLPNEVTTERAAFRMYELLGANGHGRRVAGAETNPGLNAVTLLSQGGGRRLAELSVKNVLNGRLARERAKALEQKLPELRFTLVLPVLDSKLTPVWYTCRVPKEHEPYAVPRVGEAVLLAPGLADVPVLSVVHLPREVVVVLEPEFDEEVDGPDSGVNQRWLEDHGWKKFREVPGPGNRFLRLGAALSDGEPGRLLAKWVRDSQVVQDVQDGRRVV